jgi:hypothetical protein
MFADALQDATRFTRPIVQSVRFFDGSTEAGIMACVFINQSGWFVTAAHVLDAVMAAQQHAPEMLAYDTAAQAIRSNPKLNSAQRHKQLRRLRPNDKWITHQSTILSDGAQIVEWRASRDIDLAVGRAVPFDPATISVYPRFKNPQTIRPGTSLCRLGYPFLPVTCSFDIATNQFDVRAESIAFFPNDGIYTREITGDPSPNGPFTVRFIETSSPGLKGQSGGPLFDRHGFVWGIQSQTRHLDLGFNPNLKVAGGKPVEVYQFLNVGWAVHPLTIHEFLTHEKIEFHTE